MKPNKYFSPKRFCRLLSAYVLLNYKRYLFTFVGAAIGMYLILLLNMTNTYREFGASNYVGMFMLGVLALGAFIGNAFPEWNDKIKTGNYLLLPASTFEKLLSQFLIYIVFGTFCFFLLFWIDAHLAQWTALGMESAQERGVVIHDFQFSMLYSQIDELRMQLLITMFIITNGLFLFTARLFFKRFALVKSIITGAVIFYLCMCCFVLFSHIFYPETTGFNIELPNYEVIGDVHNFEIFFFVLAYSLWAFLLPLAYYKLKEKQV